MEHEKYEKSFYLFNLSVQQFTFQFALSAIS